MDSILRNAKISDSRDLVDVGIQAGKIVAIEPAETSLANMPDAPNHDLAGKSFCRD